MTWHIRFPLSLADVDGPFLRGSTQEFVGDPQPDGAVYDGIVDVETVQWHEKPASDAWFFQAGCIYVGVEDEPGHLKAYRPATEEELRRWRLNKLRRNPPAARAVTALNAYQDTLRATRNVNRPEFLDAMLRVIDLAKAQGDGYTLAHALTACGHWMWNAGRLREALDYFEQRLDPAVWHEDGIEIRCVREFVEEIRRELRRPT